MDAKEFLYDKINNMLDEDEKTGGSCEYVGSDHLNGKIRILARVGIRKIQIVIENFDPTWVKKQV